MKLKNIKKTAILILLVFINILIKGIFISSNSLAGDEPFSVYHAQMNITSIINLLSEGNNPPLYEIILHFWIKIFNISEFSVRIPSLIFSCLTLIYIYKIGLKYLNNRIAFYSSFVFIFSNYHILFAHEARVYAFLGMITAISMYYFIGIIYDFKIFSEVNKKNAFNFKETSKYLILGVVNTLIIYSHYFGFFILIVQIIFLLLNLQIIIKLWKNLLISFTITALLYLPNILVFFNRFIESSGGTWVQPPEGLECVYNMLWKFSNAPLVTVCIISLFVFSIVKYITHFKKQLNNIYYSFVIFWFVFIFCFMFIVSFWIPMFLDRYLMPAAIGFPLVVGISVDYLIKKTKYNLIIPFVITLLFISTVKPDITNKSDVKEIVAKIKNLKTSSTIVYLCPDWLDLNFVYYYNKKYFKDYDDKNIKNKIHQYLKLENIFPINSCNQIDTNRINYLTKIIYLDAAADFHYPENNIKNKLDLNFKLKNKFKFNEVYNVYEYDIN